MTSNTTKPFMQQFAKPLSKAIRYYTEQCPHWLALTQGADLSSIHGVADLPRLPIISKDDLPQTQQQYPPFGNLRCFGGSKPLHLYRSPGPIYEFDNHCDNFWHIQTAMEAAGFNFNDRIANTFSYHYTPAGFMFDEGARRLGAQVLPAGPGSSEQLLEAIAHLQITAYMGTPDFLKIILDKAAEENKDISSLCKALVSGGYLSPVIKEQCQAQGIAVYQCYATADVGLIAYEKEGMAGLVCSDNIWVEIVNPQTLQPVDDGETGEVIVSRLSEDAPLLRFATGDLSALLIEDTANTTDTAHVPYRQLKGWLGRSDATVKVKGQFIRPVQLQNLLGQFPEVADIQLQIGTESHLDTLCLHVAVNSATQQDDALTARLRNKFQVVTGLKTEIKYNDTFGKAFTSLIVDNRIVE